MPLFRSTLKDLGNTTYPYIDSHGSLSIPKYQPVGYTSQVVSNTSAALKRSSRPVELLQIERMANNARNRAIVQRPRRTRRRGRQNATQVISAPVAQGGIVRNVIPRVSALANGLVVSHSEPISTMPLTAAGLLNYFRFSLIPPVFPYLNGLANNFGKWNWVKLRIRYVPSCPATTEGESAMGLVFDTRDAAAATFVQVTSLSKAISFPPWGGFQNGNSSTSISIDVNVNEFDKPKYSYITSAGFTALTTSDQNNYCPVSLACATQGSTAGSLVGGRIWADYTIQLHDPIVPGLNV